MSKQYRPGKFTTTYDYPGITADYLEVVVIPNRGRSFYLQGDPWDLSKHAKKLEHSDKVVAVSMSPSVQNVYKHLYGQSFTVRGDFTTIVQS